MGLATIVLALLLLLPESWTRGAAAQPTGGLREGFYSQSCPQAEFIARQTLQANLFLDLTAPAALLRLVFHDCQVQVYSSASITREQFSESLVRHTCLSMGSIDTWELATPIPDPRC